MCIPKPRVASNGGRVHAGNYQTVGTGSYVCHRGVQRSARSVKFSASSPLKPLIEAIRETVHAVRRAPFDCRRLVQTEVPAPLNVRKARKSHVRRLDPWNFKREARRNEESKALA